MKLQGSVGPLTPIFMRPILFTIALPSSISHALSGHIVVLHFVDGVYIQVHVCSVWFGLLRSTNRVREWLTNFILERNTQRTHDRISHNNHIRCMRDRNQLLQRNAMRGQRVRLLPVIRCTHYHRTYNIMLLRPHVTICVRT